jgi:hypothetical protein
MGLFDDGLEGIDDDSALPDDDYIDAEVDDEELGVDYHISAQPPREETRQPDKTPSKKPENNKIRKPLTANMKARGIRMLHIVKKDGKQITFA